MSRHRGCSASRPNVCPRIASGIRNPAVTILNSWPPTVLRNRHDYSRTKHRTHERGAKPVALRP